MTKTTTNQPIELSDTDLEHVTGGGLLHFVRQFFASGNEATNTDPNLATHSASYTMWAS
jgi:hypothetical protein